jgi:hypothetical protein
MWLIALKVGLIVWLVIAVAVVVVVGIRRSRCNRGDTRWSSGKSPRPGFVASLRGNMPATPRPEWADQNNDEGCEP